MVTEWYSSHYLCFEDNKRIESLDSVRCFENRAGYSENAFDVDGMEHTAKRVTMNPLHGPGSGSSHSPMGGSVCKELQAEK